MSKRFMIKTFFSGVVLSTVVALDISKENINVLVEKAHVLGEALRSVKLTYDRATNNLLTEL